MYTEEDVYRRRGLLGHLRKRRKNDYDIKNSVQEAIVSNHSLIEETKETGEEYDQKVDVMDIPDVTYNKNSQTLEVNELLSAQTDDETPDELETKLITDKRFLQIFNLAMKKHSSSDIPWDFDIELYKHSPHSIGNLYVYYPSLSMF